VHPWFSTHLLLILTVLGFPLLATFVMEGVEALIETLGWRIRLGRTGWDLCVLAVGSTGGIFALPEVVHEWGEAWSRTLGLFCLLVSFSCGVFIVHLRKTPVEKVKGWQTFLAVGLGIAALAFPSYFLIMS
jgi:hypothetical protein